jgi:hypothetical protein
MKNTFRKHHIRTPCLDHFCRLNESGGRGAVVVLREMKGKKASNSCGRTSPDNLWTVGWPEQTEVMTVNSIDREKKGLSADHRISHTSPTELLTIGRPGQAVRTLDLAD